MTHQPRQKKIILEFTFEEQEFYGDTVLALTSIERTRSDLTPDELDRLGDTIGQTDRWQVDRWADIQQALSDSNTPRVKVTE